MKEGVSQTGADMLKTFTWRVRRTGGSWTRRASRRGCPRRLSGIAPWRSQTAAACHAAAAPPGTSGTRSPARASAAPTHNPVIQKVSRNIDAQTTKYPKYAETDPGQSIHNYAETILGRPSRALAPQSCSNRASRPTQDALKDARMQGC